MSDRKSMLVVVRSSSSSSSSSGDDEEARGGDGNETSENDASSSSSGDVSMSFAEELRKRGIKDASDIKSDDDEGVGSSSNNPFANVAKAVKSPFASSDAAPKPPPRFAQQRDGDRSGGANKEEDDQLKKSRLLNSEGLEGFPTRAGELLKLAVTSTVSFAPLIAVISVITIGTWSIFGADFIHGGVSRDFGGGVPKYVAPETLLAEPTVDAMVPLRSPNIVDAEY